MDDEFVASFIAFWIGFAMLFVSLACTNLRSIWLAEMGTAAAGMALSEYGPAWTSKLAALVAYLLLLFGLWVFFNYGCFGVP